MGRHETFEIAEPLLTDQHVQRASIFSFGAPVAARQEARGAINEPGFDSAVTALLTRETAPPAAATLSLPEPGSAEAKAQFHAACIRTDSLARDAIHGYPMLERTGMEWWTRHALDAALEAGEIEPTRYAALYPFAFEREHRIDAASLATNINVYFALAYADEYTPRPPEGTLQSSSDNGGDADLLALSQSFEAAHSAWLAAARANDEPAERCNAHIEAAMARGAAVIPAHEEAWALPGVKAANDLEEITYSAIADLAMKVLSMRPKTLDGLALQARAITPLIWIDGYYEKDASLGEGEDLSKEAVRRLVESVLSLSGASHDAERTEAAGSVDVKQSDVPQVFAVSPEQEDAATELVGDDDALRSAITAHEQAYASFGDAVVAADRIAIDRAGGDMSDSALASLKAAELTACTREEQAWRDVFQARPSTLSGLLLLLRHAAEHYDSNSDMADAPDVFGALIGAVEGLRFATRSRPSEHDLLLLSISELEHLSQIADRQGQTLMAVEMQGLCWRDDWEAHSPLGKIIAAEGERMCFLADHAVHEIERRRPTEMREINLRLEALVRHDLNCNGYIEPNLLAEVVQAWSAR